jgi:hypothetical protein
MPKAIIRKPVTDLAVETSLFTDYLKELGLPTDNVIAETDEREIVLSNLHGFIATLTPEEKKDARYLSKFVGATAIGLFDAALNYVWNEVVINLRKKADYYGIDLFFDAAVGGAKREFYKNEDDLSGLKDNVLLDTCKKLELISEVVYLKLVHVLTMRNEVAASHPNIESIGGFELLGWLQTCVKDVLQDSISESAIRIKSIVHGIKSKTDVIDKHTQKSFTNELENLARPHIHNLLISLFGMYTDLSSDVVLKKNISLIAKPIWDISNDELKYKIGVKLDNFRTNMLNEKVDRATEFLSFVDGHRYETLDARAVNLNNLTEKLLDAHLGWDNFHYEPVAITLILKFCKKIEDIPSEILPQLIKVVLRCRIGKGLTYSQGVSPSGKPLYDTFIAMLNDDSFDNFMYALFSIEVKSKLTNPICQTQLKTILEIYRNNIVSERKIEAIDFLLNDIKNAHKAHNKDEFKSICAPFMKNFNQVS